jgi:hypothetical protein
MLRSRPRRFRPATIALLLATMLVAACGEDAGGRGTDASDGSVATRRGSRPKPAPYREVTLDSVGRVGGAVEIDGPVPRDSTIHLAGDAAQVCGATQPLRTLQARGQRVAGVVVWLEGVRAGKSLPLERRYTLEHSGCLLAPRSQAAVTGGTLNVVNEDQFPHMTVVRRQGDDAPLDTLYMAFDGQVVPLDRALREPGVLEISCSADPAARAWVHVFDHPYFATTGADGTFAIDSVPPGSYTLVAWHERLGELRHPVTVSAGQAASVTIKGPAK